jgi:membrane-associated protease RseP (regulator of RpoE activity)
MVGVVEFLVQYKAIILFYLAIVIWVVLKWKKFDVQAKIIFLYRMKFGLKGMDKYAKKFREWIVLLGYIGTGLGFIGMVFISYILLKNLYDIFMVPDVASGVSLVLPGVNVPGLGVLPFWYWLIAIFVIAVVHEFAHGIVARAHNIPVLNSGIVLFGPILGAFVEPDENKLRKQSDIAQHSVLAAGSFSNILLAVLAFVLLMFVTTPLVNSMVDPAGFTFGVYVEGDYPFQNTGIQPGTIITGIDGVPIINFQGFAEELQFHKSGEDVTIMTTAGEQKITLGEHPDNPRNPFLGINEITNEVEIKSVYQSGVAGWVYSSLNWLNGFFRWLFILSLGIGLFNLLPLPIVDGGRMAQVFLHKLKGVKLGEKRYRQISLFLLIVLILNFVAPFLLKFF